MASVIAALVVLTLTVGVDRAWPDFYSTSQGDMAASPTAWLRRRRMRRTASARA